LEINDLVAGIGGNVVDFHNMPDFRMVWTDGTLDGERILKLSGPFILPSVFDFQSEIRKNPAPITIIDMTEVPYMDSAALGSLMGFHVSCQQRGRRYALAGASDRLRTVFRVAGVNSIVTLVGSVAEAEAVLGETTASA
jgi:anti-anti-sigma factor